MTFDIFEVVMICVVVAFVFFWIGMSTGVSIKLIEPKSNGAVTWNRADGGRRR